MYKKLTTIFLLTIFFSGCATVKDPYILSNIFEIRLLEKQDHKLCTALKLNFDRKDNFLNRAYWRCRLSFAKYRLSVGKNATPDQAKRDLEIRDLLTKISLRISETPESVVIRENQKMDNRDHKKCLVMGFELETEDLAKIEDYFVCRKILIDEKQVVPPYGNLDYLKHQNRSYNIGFVVDQRVNEAIALYNVTKEKYPTCVSYNIYSINFKRCIASQDKARQCNSEVEGKKFRREGEEKVTCQKLSYVRFDDSLLKIDEQKKRDLDKKNNDADYHNNQSFSALGIDGTKFFAQDDEENSTKKDPKKINSKAGLYEKFELTKLRQKYISACQKEAESRVENFTNELKKSCNDLAKFEVVGEE